MLPWNPPLWLTVTVVAVPIAINLMTIVSKKAITERLNGEQENEPHSKGVAYWTHAIASRIAIVVNIVATAIAILLLLTGTTWIGINFPHAYFITTCALVWILSLYLTWSFFQVRDKSHDTDVRGSNALTDPNDRAAINYAIGWILSNVTLDAVMWLVMSHPWTTHY